MHRLLRLILVLALSAVTTAQLDSIPVQLGQALYLEGGLAMHDNGTGLMAFSGATRSWTQVAPTGSNVLARGHWVALIEDPDGRLHFYLARTGKVVTPPDAATPFNSNAQRGVTDDLGFVAYARPNGTWRLFCTSAKGSDFRTFSGEITPAVTRTTVLASDRLGMEQFHVGFAARTGYFETTPLETSLTRTYSGQGNAGCITTPGKLHVFSGVLGFWSTIPAPELHLTADNVVLARVVENAAENTVRYRAYSAYDGTWVDSSVYDTDTTPLQHRLDDNWCAVRSGTTTWEAIGARPHQAWDLQTDAGPTLSSSADGFVLSQGPQTAGAYVVQGFSGLRNGTIQTQGMIEPQAPTVQPYDHMLHLRDGERSVFYSPMSSSFVGSLFHGSTSGGLTSFGTSGAVLRRVTDETFFGFGVGGTTFTPNPDGATPLVVRYSADTLLALQNLADNDSVRLWDTRRRIWQPKIQAGAGAVVETKGNVLAVTGPQGTFAYSVQSGRWLQFSDPSGAPVAVPAPQLYVEDDLAIVVANGYLTGFGAADDVHPWYDYPVSPDYLVPSLGSSAITTRFDATITRPAGTLVLNFIDTSRLESGIPLGPPITGNLWLSNPMLVDSFSTSEDNQRWSVLLPYGVPGLQQYWTQSVFSNPGGPTPFQLSNAPQSLVLF